MRIEDRFRARHQTPGSRVPITLQALAKQLNVHCNPTKLSFERCALDVERVEAWWASKRLVIVLAQGRFPVRGDLRSVEDQLQAHQHQPHMVLHRR